MMQPLKIVAIIGLVLGGLFGILGTNVTDRHLQSAFWAIDGVGLIVATALLSINFFRAGNDLLAAGFLVFSMGESVMLIGTADTLQASAPSFAAGTALWSAALLLISLPSHFATWIRATGILAALLFAITSASIFWGQPVLPTSSPLPFFAYPFLVLNFAGWIWTLIRAK